MEKWSRDSLLVGCITSTVVMILVSVVLWLNNQRLNARDGFIDPKAFKNTPDKILETVREIKTLQQQQTKDVHELKEYIMEEGPLH